MLNVKLKYTGYFVFIRFYTWIVNNDRKKLGLEMKA